MTYVFISFVLIKRPACNYVCMYVFHLVSIMKMQVYIYTFLKAVMIKNNSVCDVKCVTPYTK